MKPLHMLNPKLIYYYYFNVTIICEKHMLFIQLYIPDYFFN